MKCKLTLILCGLLLLPLLFSCGDGKDPVQTSGKNTVEEEKEYHPETEYQPEIKNFGNYEFNICTNARDPALECVFVDEESWGSTRISRAVFERNAYVESLYGIIINEKNQYRPVEEAASYLLAMDLSGEYYADVFAYYCTESMAFASNGYFRNIYDANSLKLEGSWYEQDFLRTITIDDHAYLLTGDMQTDDEIHQIALMVNYSKFRDSFEDDLYDIIVNQEAWTIDKFFSYWKGYGQDLNDDGLDARDTIGYSYDNMTFSMFFISSGIDVMTVQKDGEDFEITVNTSTDKAFNLIDKLGQILDNPGDTVRATSKDEFSYGGVRDLFASGHTLFITNTFGDALGYYLDMTDDVYYLPYPKYDENQLNYRCPVHAYFEPWAILRGVEDFERTALIVEAMTYYSENVTKEIRQSLIQLRLAKNVEINQLLTLITTSKAYDFDYMTGISGQTDLLSNLIKSGSVGTYSSDVAGYDKAAIRKASLYISKYIQY